MPLLDDKIIREDVKTMLKQIIENFDFSPDVDFCTEYYNKDEKIRFKEILTEYEMTFKSNEDEIK